MENFEGVCLLTPAFRERPAGDKPSIQKSPGGSVQSTFPPGEF